MTTPAIEAQRLAKVAQEIVDAKPGAYDHFIEGAAQLYLDNLADGYCEPDELIELLAERAAEDDHQGVCWHYERRNKGNPYPLDFGTWYDERKADYIKSVRNVYALEVVA